MSELRQVERRLLELTTTFDLRPTLEKAADIGDLLLEARSLVKHGEWANWLDRIGLRPRTAWDYLAVARARDANRWPATEMTIKQFLAYIRSAGHAERRWEREQAQEQARKSQADLPDNLVLAHADCRLYRWPRPLDVIVADPPWSDLTAYDWLASWAAEQLREGGLLLVQCGHAHLPRVMACLGRKLNYLWTLAVVFPEMHHTRAIGRFTPGWRPVLLYARGQAGTPERMSDTYTVRTSMSKSYHQWEQPLEPWRYWLARLVPPGSLVADPFAGSGVVGVVCGELGLRYVGTEQDAATCRVARGRICQAVQGESEGG